jgi:hypothetical protein
VINGDINGIEVIRPRRSTNVSNIGVRPLRLLGIDVLSIKINIHDFIVPRGTSVEFESDSELSVSW